MHSILAITDAATASAATVDLTVLGSEAMPLILNLLWALAILLLGWLLAGVLSGRVPWNGVNPEARLPWTEGEQG